MPSLCKGFVAKTASCARESGLQSALGDVCERERERERKRERDRAMELVNTPRRRRRYARNIIL